MPIPLSRLSSSLNLRLGKKKNVWICMYVFLLAQDMNRARYFRLHDNNEYWHRERAEVAHTTPTSAQAEVS
jgi:hypothetical protein